jgi:hypothetical protein
VAKATATKTAAKTAIKTGTAVAKVPVNSTAVDVPQELQDLFVQDAGAGLQNATTQDYALPFLYMLQSNSPQVDKAEDKYVEGAEAGMFMDTVTQELFDSLKVIPVEFEKVYNEWIPRDAGGGFIASYKSKNEAEQNKQDDTQIVDTANHYVLVEGNDGRWRPAILSCTSTKLKASRNWLSRISQVLINGARGRESAPSYARIYEAVAVSAKNKKGKFFTLGINPIEGPEGWVRDIDLYNAAKDFAAQLKAGRKGADYNAGADEVVDAEIEDESDGAEFVNKRR